VALPIAYFSPLRRWKKSSTRAPFSHFVGGKYAGETRFISPIHPIPKNLEYWHYKWGENPIAEKHIRGKR